MQLHGVVMDLFKGADAPERSGHKYTHRWWNGTKWEYEYSDEPAEQHGGVEAVKLAEVDTTTESRSEKEDAPDRTVKRVRAHRHSIETGAVPPGTPPEQAYKAAMSKPGTRPVKHPAFKEPLSVTVAEDGSVSVASGEDSLEFASQKAKDVPRKQKDFKSTAAFEWWFLKSSNTVGFSDPEGKPWLMISPVIGQVDNAANEVKWSSVANRQWSIQYHPSYTGKQGKFGDSAEYSMAIDQVVSEYNAKASATGAERISAQAILAKHPNPAALPNREEHKEAHTTGQDAPSLKPGEREDMSADDKKAYESADVDKLPEAKPGSAAAFLQNEAKWGYDESRPKGQRRFLKVSDAEKQKLVNDVAHEFWPAIVSIGDRWMNNPLHRDSRDDRMEELIGAGGDYLATRTPDRDSLFLEPDKPIAQAIESALNNYDPEFRREDGKKVGFAGYLIGANGKIANTFQYHLKSAGDKEKVLGGGRYDSSGRPVGETRGATEEQKEDRADLMNPEEQMAAQYDPKEVANKLTPFLMKWAMANPEKKPIIDRAKSALRMIRTTTGDKQRMHMDELLSVLAEPPPKGAGMVSDLSKLMGKSLSPDDASFLVWLGQFSLMKKAMAVLTKDKHADPNHEYSHMEGDEDNPRYYWRDEMGNMVRYTNAPQGHDERADHFGEAKPHPGEPMFDKNPEYYDPAGRKLTRAPEVDPATVEWNQRYNRFDPKNLWIGRWRNPETGQYIFTYVHSDIRLIPKLQIHQSNALTDVRIPSFRKYTAKLFNGSGKIKDQMTAVALALLDQGKMRSIELAALTSDVVQLDGNMITLGSRKIFGCPKMVAAIDMLKRTTPGGMPLFSVPMQTTQKIDPLVRRMMGPHYLARVVDSQGMSLLGLQVYHGTISFSREVDRAIIHYGASWEQAVQYALMVVAKEWGHDLTVEPDPLRVLQLVQEVLVDPVVVTTMQQNAKQQGLIGASPSQMLPLPTVPIPFVAIDAVDRNAEEQEFSDWIHQVPMHQFAEYETEVVDPSAYSMGA